MFCMSSGQANLHTLQYKVTNITTYTYNDVTNDAMCCTFNRPRRLKFSHDVL